MHACTFARSWSWISTFISSLVLDLLSKTVSILLKNELDQVGLVRAGAKLSWKFAFREQDGIMQLY